MSKLLQKVKNDARWEIYGILLITVGMLGIFSIYTDAVGLIGIFLNKNLRGLAGQAAFAVPAFIIIWGIYCLRYKKNPESMPRAIGFLIMFFVLIWLLHLNLHTEMAGMTFLNRLKQSASSGLKGLGGGIIGEAGNTLFLGVFGSTGSYILMATLMAVGIILVTGFSFSYIIKSTKNKLSAKNINIITPKEENDSNIKKHDIDIEVINNEPETSKQDKPKVEVLEKPFTVDENSTKATYTKYNFPSLSFLKKDTSRQNIFSEKELLSNAQVLEKTLDSFGVQAKVVQVSCGPMITRYEIQPQPGVKVSRIVNLADDIALTLAASDVRIEAPIPGKAAIGIEVPNKTNAIVHLRDVLDTTEFQTSHSKLTIALGKDIGGNPVIADLSEMPHLLIAGATGSGKSVCINTIITSILYKSHPNEVKLLLIDPKVVELSVYNGIPHLFVPVVTDAKKAAAALNWMVSEMEKRYQMFAQEGVRDINRYNELCEENPLCKILVIIDELADLMMISPRDVEDSICRLAQMARAAGIHLVVATQRPSVDIITGLIKANIPSRISFAVSSQVDSRTILDMAGAEKLLGKGDMLFFPVGAAKPTRIQGAYISENEVEKIVEYVKRQMGPTYEKSLLDVKDVAHEKKEEDLDELFNEALAVIIDSGQASISMLQRRLRIGYTRAARIIDQMEEKGFIGGYDGSKPREILITKERVEKYFHD
jgi:S-DNA-T family DNA segregation ATPase FtsK/SpoIIIE